MNALANNVKILFHRKVLQSSVVEQYVSSMNVLINASQRRFKGRKTKTAATKTTEKPIFKRLKKHEAVVVDWVVSPTPSTDDVWIHKYFPTRTHSFSEAIQKHRELASQEMTNNADGLVMLEALINLSTKKKTKFLAPPSGIVLMPNNFDNFFPGRVIAITKCTEEQSRATEAGAIYSGGAELIRKVERGDISPDDYDCIVLSDNLLVEAAVLKKILKDLFPTKKNGNLGTDVESMVKKFTHGKEFSSTHRSESEGNLSFPIGRLSMSDEELEENLMTILDIAHSSKGGDKYYKQLTITCPPSKEKIVVVDKSIMPAASSGDKMNKIEDEDVEEVAAATV